MLWRSDKINQPEPREKFRSDFLKKSRWARQPGDTAPSVASHRGRGCPAVAPRGSRTLPMGRADAPAAPSPRSFTHLLGWLLPSSPRAQSFMISDEIFLAARHNDMFALWLFKQMGLFLGFYFFFQYKISLFCSTAGGREDFEVNNVLHISCHLNEYITFHFDLWLHLRVTIIYHTKMGYLQCCSNIPHEHGSNYLPSLNNYN